MDWSDERYVRLYTRDTADWVSWRWEARALLPLLLKRSDRSGLVEVRSGERRLQLLAALVGIPAEVTKSGIEELLQDGCVVETESGYIFPNFIEAQESRQSDAQRQRDSREKRRAAQLAPTLPPKPRKPKESQQKQENSHSASPDVTSGHSSLAVPCLPSLPTTTPPTPPLAQGGEIGLAEPVPGPAPTQEPHPPPPGPLPEIEGDPQAEQVWKKALEHVEASGKRYALTWLRRIGRPRLVAQELVLGVSDRFFLEWVDDHYRGLIAEALDAIAPGLTYRLETVEGLRLPRPEPDLPSASEPGWRALEVPEQPRRKRAAR